MSDLVLSCFSGMDAFGYAFELEGFCVVSAPEILLGRDIRNFHPPAGRFDGMLLSDPCQAHSSLSNLVRAKGLEPSFPDMTSEAERLIDEAQPMWWLRENVPQAPDLKPVGYNVRSFLLDNSTLDSGDGTGNEQMRRRRFWFGVRSGVKCPELRKWIDFALFQLPDAERPVTMVTNLNDPNAPFNVKRRQQAVAGDAQSVPVALGGSGKRKTTAVAHEDSPATRAERGPTRWTKTAPVTGRNEGAVGAPGIDYSPPRRTLEDMLRLQGLPEDWFGHAPLTMSAKRKMVGNAVAVPTGRALARAIRCWLEEKP